MERETPRSYERAKAQGPESSFTLAPLCRAAASGEGEKVKPLKEQLVSEFPDQLEMVEAITDLPRYLDVCTQLDVHAEKGKERQKLIREKAEYHFLLTHLVSSINDQKTLMRFWDALGRMAQAQKRSGQYSMMRAGVLSQVATYKILQQLDRHPTLSHPSEDQYNAIDLWQESNPIQVKSGHDDQPFLVEVDRLTPSHIAIQGGDGQRRIGSELLQDIERFTTGLQTYEKTTGRHLTGYLLTLPKSSYDKVTGEPSEEIVQFVKEHLGHQIAEGEAA